MPIELKMPALSPTMEEGTLAKWLVKEGDAVSSGDILAEIETDKATMEFEAIDEGTIAKILVAEGTDEVKVGTVIAIIAEEGEDAGAVPSPVAAEAAPPSPPAGGEGSEERRADDRRSEDRRAENRDSEDRRKGDRRDERAEAPAPSKVGDRVKASPLARRIAEQKGLDLSAMSGSGPGGRIVKADIEGAAPGKP
ncbi:MAG: E3 binding domain-containing protein, partial [Sphingomonadaceae bacterium]|nr:E3 binding domain-containing protein [Sphingomonadaceae bacterium]